MTAEIASRRRYVPKRRNTLVSAVVILCGLLGGSGVLLGALGMPWLSARQSWLFVSSSLDSLNNFLPIWLAILALGMAIAVFQRGRSRLFWALGSLVLVIGLVPVALELYQAPERVNQPLAAAPRAIRIVQFNALAVNYNLGAALDLALGSDADIIMVEEPLRFRTLEPYLQARYPFSTPCPRDRCRAIIYSRLPPLDAGYTTPRGTWYRRGFWDANGSIGLASMRLLGPDGAPFTVIATHFRWPFPPMPVLHQRDVFIDQVARQDRTRAIVGGDFNLTPWTYEMRALDAGLQPMQRVTRGLFSFPVPFTGTSLPIPFPILPIDHIYAGSRWQLVSAKRGPVAGSDHYPVIVDLVMPVSSDGS